MRISSLINDGFIENHSPFNGQQSLTSLSWKLWRNSTVRKFPTIDQKRAGSMNQNGENWLKIRKLRTQRWWTWSLRHVRCQRIPTMIWTRLSDDISARIRLSILLAPWQLCSCSSTRQTRNSAKFTATRNKRWTTNDQAHRVKWQLASSKTFIDKSSFSKILLLSGNKNKRSTRATFTYVVRTFCRSECQSLRETIRRQCREKIIHKSTKAKDAHINSHRPEIVVESLFLNKTISY